MGFYSYYQQYQYGTYTQYQTQTQTQQATTAATRSTAQASGSGGGGGNEDIANMQDVLGAAGVDLRVTLLVSLWYPGLTHSCFFV
jgi:hypothetical protein